MLVEEEDYLAHYGILRKSGRYPWGSGEDQYAINKGFIGTVTDLKKKGYSETDICKMFAITDKDGNVTDGFSTTQLRNAMKIAKNENRAADISQAQRLKEKGTSNSEIGRIMGINESSVRSLLKASTAEKTSVLLNMTQMLEREVAANKFIDVGEGVSHHVGVSKHTFDAAVAALKEKGYAVHTIQVDQLGTGKKTNVKVLAPPDTTWPQVNANRDSIRMPNHKIADYGRSVLGIAKPLAIDPKRVKVRWAEEGGKEADGVLYVRPGVKDVELGGNMYAQVRVQVGKGHYLKGMAVYKDGLPRGTDIVFNTNKSKVDTGGDPLKAMKPLKTKKDGSVDEDNPFGSNISRQITIKDRHGNDKATSVMNLVNEEGSWAKWSNTLSSQMLSKQTPKLAKEQLDRTLKNREREFERISKLTNPEVRRKMLIAFGDECDSAAVHLKAAGISGTKGHHVIIPIDSISPTKVYAPNYPDGMRVALIRHPHGGTFEIPELVVDNKNREAKKVLGRNPIDAIGIHHSVAQRLSGADFDGDTVLVIPNNSNKIKRSSPLKDLENFDPVTAYPKYPGMKVMKEATKGREMGDITNLITDMTIKNAPASEIARAVKHSMVVIDAAKHELNYKQSAIDNGIPALKQKYQGGSRKGASTLISLAGSQEHVPNRSERRASEGGPIDKKTGERIYVESTKPGRSITIPKLALTKDAHTLSSGTPMEKIYADYSNQTKQLANKSRQIGVNIKNSPTSSSAKKVYAKEVEELKVALSLAKRNAPLERQAQIFANAIYRQKLHANPDMDEETKKKVRYQALTEMRNRAGAKKHPIEITKAQWDAIQAGAISSTMLTQILANANMDRVQELASPRPKALTSVKVGQAKALLDAGYSKAEVAKKLGVSTSTIDRELGLNKLVTK